MLAHVLVKTKSMCHINKLLNINFKHYKITYMCRHLLTWQIWGTLMLIPQLIFIYLNACGFDVIDGILWMQEFSVIIFFWQTGRHSNKNSIVVVITAIVRSLYISVMSYNLKWIHDVLLTLSGTSTWTPWSSNNCTTLWWPLEHAM